jgi:hypothetical protein
MCDILSIPHSLAAQVRAFQVDITFMMSDAGDAEVRSATFIHRLHIDGSPSIVTQLTVVRLTTHTHVTTPRLNLLSILTSVPLALIYLYDL